MKRNQLPYPTTLPDRVLPTPEIAETIFLLVFVMVTSILVFALS